MQQLRECQFSKTVALVRDSAHIIRKFAQSKLDVFFSRAISAAENQHPRRKRRGCCSHKVVAVGFNTLCYDASVGVLNPPHE